MLSLSKVKVVPALAALSILCACSAARINAPTLSSDPGVQTLFGRPTVPETRRPKPRGRTLVLRGHCQMNAFGACVYTGQVAFITPGYFSSGVACAMAREPDGTMSFVLGHLRGRSPLYVGPAHYPGEISRIIVLGSSLRNCLK